ncbi:serine hydrolase domain-containing protein [Streptomyces vilmorinianum]|uniref:serine hydrolase domain-containing protein n=1 Tax=Streptomyces vilmorinianum TaxID=3051092 RepID=UPI0010FB767E|nr:serine hydrolase domain-containing protein [Streptomyces vilmorinianum]
MSSPRLYAVAAATVLALSAAALPAQAAGLGPGHGSPVAGQVQSQSQVQVQSLDRLDRAALRGSLDAFHKAGMYGAYSAVRDGSARWRGATGFADVGTQRPTRPDLEHRIGSVTKTFTAVAVLQQAAAGRIDLDAPVGRYLPDVVPGERGRQVTVRMLLNHTSGIADYVLPAFPGLLENPGKTLDENRFRDIAPEELARLGLAAPPVVERGTFSYANTNYILAGLLLERVTGQEAEAYITRNVIRKAGLRHTYFPRSASLKGPHARMYESFYGLIDPPRDYSVYDMSWAGTAGAMVSTTSDLNDFYRALLSGRLLGAAQLREMKTTVPAYETEPGEEAQMRYGLGIYTLKLPSGGWYWGHDGAVFGAGTWALSTEDGRRQVAIGYNLMKYQRFDDQGRPLPDPVTAALYAHVDGALSGAAAAARRAAPQHPPVLPDRLLAPDALRHASLR